MPKDTIAKVVYQAVFFDNFGAEIDRGEKRATKQGAIFDINTAAAEGNFNTAKIEEVYVLDSVDVVSPFAPLQGFASTHRRRAVD